MGGDHDFLINTLEEQQAFLEGRIATVTEQYYQWLPDELE